MAKINWPSFRSYTGEHLQRIALPLGGIGTGTVSLGGRGNLTDWEIMNRPAKGFVPGPRFSGAPFLCLRAQPIGGAAVTRLLEGPVPASEIQGDFGSVASNHGWPRFREARFDTAYPLGQVHLHDPSVPLRARLEAFNPFVPADVESSSWPLAVVRCVLSNPGPIAVRASVCLSVPNFVGHDGSEGECAGNRNRRRSTKNVQGILMDSTGVDDTASQWGSLALATTAQATTSRLAWKQAGWGTSVLDFWDDFHGDGRLENRQAGDEKMPIASLAATASVPAGAERSITFLLAWHFPNRPTWTPCGEADGCDAADDLIGNQYTQRFSDAWDVIRCVTPKLKELERRTVEFVDAFCSSDLPDVVKEAALFNLSTLRTQTCFRTPDGYLYGFEGYLDRSGCCLGSCTHVWNYEQSLAFLFGDLARGMREIEFEHATAEDGLMSFRVHLPLDRAQQFGKGAADGQMGCIVKVYREWQLCGDDEWLRRLWPHVRRALEFCWIPGGWDADQDGVMEGCQHNTMDVEYYGPNPQMGTWYLAALRASQQMALQVGEAEFAERCGSLYESGRAWMDEYLFNGEYYEHEVRPPKSEDDIAPALRLGAGAANVKKPDYQLASGCLVDQLIGQLLAHVCDLGHLLKPANIKRTLRSISKYNGQASLQGHFNVLRSYALGDEAALLMASYPKQRPENPFPYFTEVMTGFEYTAAIGMLYEGQETAGLRHMTDIRDRYDGRKRNPFDEAECGHHYARAMIAWAAHLAWTGFHYYASEQRLRLAARPGQWFVSTGDAWGTAILRRRGGAMELCLHVLGGAISVREVVLQDWGQIRLPRTRVLRGGSKATWRITGED
jgi:non-lysosomal glucosylceramidase